MAVDWLTIRNDYVNGGGSYRKLAEKYGVSFSVLKDIAVKENWRESKERQMNETRTKTERKSQEKISDALSDEAAEKVRIRVSLLKMAANWVEAQAGTVRDSGDFRRMVQSCVEMGVFDEAVRLPGRIREDDPLTRALKEEAERLNHGNQ